MPKRKTMIKIGNVRLGYVSHIRENKDTKKLRKGFRKTEIDGED